MTAQLSSVSVVLPACNDGGTIASMVLLVLDTLAQVTTDCEVIVVDRKSTRLNSSHTDSSRMPSSA